MLTLSAPTSRPAVVAAAVVVVAAAVVVSGIPNSVLSAFAKARTFPLERSTATSVPAIAAREDSFNHQGDRQSQRETAAHSKGAPVVSDRSSAGRYRSVRNSNRTGNHHYCHRHRRCRRRLLLSG